MEKLALRVSQLGAKSVLTRAQQKEILGGRRTSGGCERCFNDAECDSSCPRCKYKSSGGSSTCY